MGNTASASGSIASGLRSVFFIKSPTSEKALYIPKHCIGYGYIIRGYIRSCYSTRQLSFCQGDNGLFRHVERRLPVNGLERCPGCHHERSEGSLRPASQPLRCAQSLPLSEAKG